MAGGQAFEFKRAGGVFDVRPEVVVIIGRDTRHKRGEHPLFQERGKRIATQQDIAASIDAGSRCPVIEVVAEVIPDEMFDPEFLRLARKIRREEAALRGVEWDESAHRWMVVDDGRGRLIGSRAANLILTEPISLVASFEKLNEQDKVGVMMSANSHVNVYTEMQKALDLIEFRKRNKSDDIACVKLRCDAATLELYKRIENDNGECALVPEVIDAIEAGKAPFAKAAKQWAHLTPEGQREALALHLNPPPRKPREIAAPSKKQASAVADAILAGRHPTVPREVALVLQWRAGLVRAEDLPPDLAAVVLATEKGSKE